MIILQCYFLHDQVELQGDLQIFGLITLPLVINNVLLGELKSSRAQSVVEVTAYWSCVQFSGYVEMKVSHAYNQSKSWLRPCQLQNRSFESNKYVFQALYQTLQTTNITFENLLR